MLINRILTILILSLCSFWLAPRASAEDLKPLSSLAESTTNSSILFDSSWTESDRTRARILAGLLIADWHTTRSLAESNWCQGTCYETNPIMSRHPSASTVDQHFVISSLVIYTLADQLPQSRTGILDTLIGVELYVVRNNVVRFGWRWQF
jgi:hypothetical protein